MADLTDGQIAECKEVARVIIKEAFIQHINSCPHGKTLLASKMFLTGICVGSGFAGGGLVLAFAKFIIGI